MGAKLGGGGGGRFDLGQNSDINVTPFVDVMLVLLIIFMVAIPAATVSIKLDLPPAKGLQAGQVGRAALGRGTKPTITVPAAALIQRGQLTYAGVVGPDQVARLRIVRTGSTTPAGVEILAGLETGEQIASPLPPDFTSGTPVTPQP